MGAWYVQSTTPTFIQPEGSTCEISVYEDNGDGTFSDYTILTFPKNKLIEACGRGRQADPGGNRPGDLLINFPLVPTAVDYMVLGTDYENFTSVYSCMDLLGIVKLELGWVFTRTPRPQKDIVSLSPILSRRALKVRTTSNFRLNGVSKSSRGTAYP